MKITIIKYLSVAIVSLLFYGIMAAPILQYAEDWQTFYYDSELMAGTSFIGCVKDFLLQFFAHPWIGAMVMTFILLIIMAIIDALVRCIKTKNKYVKALKHCIVVILTLYFGVSFASWMGGVSDAGLVGLGSKAEQMSITYKKLSNLARQKDWDGIISLCNSYYPVENLLFQNILNMALAEKCELGEKLLDQPVQDINSIFVSQIEGPEIAAMMSDIYYSMGHIAQSQRYAFEANEKMNNMSPRLLQRLIQTNTLYGQKAVVMKYQYILSKTLFYKNDTFSDPQKQKCIFKDNRFSGIKGLDDDLLQIARNTRGTHQCQVTLNYLGSLYILAGYKEPFINMVKEFGGSKDLPKPLPLYFQKFYEKLNDE